MRNFYSRCITTFLTTIIGVQSAVAIDLPSITPEQAGYDGAQLNAITERLTAYMRIHSKLRYGDRQRR